MGKTRCDKWLDTVSDSDLGNHSQVTLANEAWNRGAAYAAQKILNHIEEIDTVAVAVATCPEIATSIGGARVEADGFIRKIKQ